MIENFIKDFEFYEDISLIKYNTYKIDTKTKYLVFPKDINELIKLIKFVKDNEIKYLILGNGSNVILDFEYYEGIIIKLDRLNKIEINANIVTVEAGYSLIKLVNEMANLGLSGLEFAGGIPGLVGSSVAMNAGAYKKEMANIVREVKVLTPNGNITIMKKKDLDFSYRNSFFKKNRDYICLSVTLELQKTKKKEIIEIMEDRKQRRLASQPLNMPSAGSVFRNPDNMHAGELIEKVGLKGLSIGGAEVSTKHANFIVNKGNATGKDIVQLVELIKTKVKENYGIDLILEQEIIR